MARRKHCDKALQARTVLCLRIHSRCNEKSGATNCRGMVGVVRTLCDKSDPRAKRTSSWFNSVVLSHSVRSLRPVHPLKSMVATCRFCGIQHHVWCRFHACPACPVQLLKGQDSRSAAVCALPLRVVVELELREYDCAVHLEIYAEE